MFIKNQVFKDEDTLLEMLFDFNLGDASELVSGMYATIDKELEENTAYTTYRDSLQDEEDRMELFAEERDLRLAEQLMEMFDSFQVLDRKLFGIKDKEKTLLYEIDLH
jgi:hypothetical protein